MGQKKCVRVCVCVCVCKHVRARMCARACACVALRNVACDVTLRACAVCVCKKWGTEDSKSRGIREDEKSPEPSKSDPLEIAPAI